MGEILSGSIIGADADGLTVRIPYRDWQRFTRQNNKVVLCQLMDGRHISPEQMRMIWALMTEIGLDAGYTKQQIEPEIYRKYFATRFRMNIMSHLRRQAFRLSNATVEQGTAFLNMLIDHCIENGVATRQPLTSYTDDITHYVYSCTMNKRCAVCGTKADLHHVDAVGMGRNRNDIVHIGMRCLPLCRMHHNKIHEHGNQWFMDKYHLEPVTIDHNIAKAYKLKEEKK